jgi:hypothetical protein
MLSKKKCVFILKERAKDLKLAEKAKKEDKKEEPAKK